MEAWMGELYTCTHSNQATQHSEIHHFFVRGAAFLALLVRGVHSRRFTFLRLAFGGFRGGVSSVKVHVDGFHHFFFFGLRRQFRFELVLLLHLRLFALLLLPFHLHFAQRLHKLLTKQIENDEHFLPLLTLFESEIAAQLLGVLLRFLEEGLYFGYFGVLLLMEQNHHFTEHILCLLVLFRLRLGFIRSGCSAAKRRFDAARDSKANLQASIRLTALVERLRSALGQITNMRRNLRHRHCRSFARPIRRHLGHGAALRLEVLVNRRHVSLDRVEVVEDRVGLDLVDSLQYLQVVDPVQSVGIHPVQRLNHMQHQRGVLVRRFGAVQQIQRRLHQESPRVASRRAVIQIVAHHQHHIQHLL
mmetsp:Transcript_75270/g.119661  ORF Transcript_75270/g.119661 Transcript_75270/m.119661 type:complete len:360 (-) Transcript_75270:216-1295(-)